MLVWALIVATAVVFGPGYALARVARIRGYLAVAAAPAISVGMAGVTALMLHFTPIPFNLWSFLATAIAMIAAGFFIAHKSEPVQATFPLHMAEIIGLSLISLLGIFLMFRNLPFPEAPAQNGDVLFHLNATALMKDSGDGGPLGVLAGMIDQTQPGYYYPTGWHDLLIILTDFVPLDLANNALVSIMIGPILVSGTALLARTAAGFLVSTENSENPNQIPLIISSLSAGILTQLGVLFPVLFGAYNGVYPFSLALGVIPGLWTLWLGAKPQNWLKSWGWILAILAGFAGVLAAHPSLFPVVFLVVMVQGTVLSALSTITWRREHYAGSNLSVNGIALGTQWLTLSVLFALGLALALSDRVKRMADFPRPGGSREQAFFELINGTAWFATSNPWTIIFVILSALGIIVSLLNPRTVAIGCGTFVFSWLAVLAAGPDGRLRNLTGFWYKDPQRLGSISYVFAVLSVCLAIAFLVALAQHLTFASGRLFAAGFATVFLACGAVVITPYTQDTYQRGYIPSRLDHEPCVSADEYQFIKTQATRLEPNKLVVGDPDNGAAYFQTFGRNRALIPFGNRNSMSKRQLYIADNFNQIGTDPKVCQLLQSANVGYFYEDTNFDPNNDHGHQFNGFYNVPKSQHFELIDGESSYKLWRIICD